MLIEVCGSETISMSNSTTFALNQFFWRYNGTSNVTTVPSSQTPSFSSSSLTCPVSGVSVKTYDGTSFQSYAGSAVTLSANNDIIMSTENALTRNTFYIFAETASGSTPAFFPMSVEVIDCLSQTIKVSPPAKNISIDY